MTRDFSYTGSQPFLPFYEVLEPLGEGAVASVYKVRTRKDGSLRALKALKPEHGETTRGIERFEDEFRILSALHHPSLPQVYDYGRGHDGRRYMVMEFLEGEPLDQYVASHKDDLWLLLFQLNEALAFIHEHGLLHLDLKPGNVLVRRTRGFGDEEIPLLMLIDFGLSYRRESGGMVKLVGTPGYMAPEVIRGEEELTRAADYYSTGVIIYELVQGRLPFEGSMEEILRAHLTRHVTFAQRRVEYTELYSWIEALMAKEPGERLAAFQEFRRLMAARQGGSIETLQRAYALGYIDSLGLIGKGEAWQELDGWTARVCAGLGTRGDVGGAARAAVDAGAGAAVPGVGQATRGAGTDVTGSEPAATDELRGDMHRGGTEDTVGRIIKGSVVNLEEKIREDLLRSAAVAMESQPPLELAPIVDVARVVALSGPPESGKTYLLRAFRHTLKLKGLSIVALGEDSDYRNLVASGRGPKKRSAKGGVDPGSIAIDRFATGWEGLYEMGSEGGVVLLVDDCHRLDQEEREFLEYVGKRVGMAIAEGKEVGVFVVAVGKRSEVKKLLPSLVSAEHGVARVEVPPPSKLDVDAVTETFRGHLSGRREQESLGVFLKDNLRTGGALYTALKQVVADGDLYYEGGMWHFTEPHGGAVATRDTAGAYYRGLVDELKPGAAALLPWLVCHPAPLSVLDVERVSGIDAGEVKDAIEALKLYRMIETVETDAGPRIDVVNEQVREGLYGAFTGKVLQRVHRRFIEHLSARPSDTADFFERLAYHNEHVGDVRSALVARIRALQRARTDRDVFAMRRLCDRGLVYVRRLRSREWKSRRWHIERYFIKCWVNAEEMATNPGGLVKVIENQFNRRGRELPLSFYYKYATALERVGDFDGCRRVVDKGKARVATRNSETYNLLLLEEAGLAYRVESDRGSCHILDRIDTDKLSPFYQARVHLIYLFNYRRLGIMEQFEHHRKLVIEISAGNDCTEHLLRANHEQAWVLLGRGRYDEAKQLLRRSIRLAQRQKEYRALSITCFVVSAVYYEEGLYQRALRFLDRAINIAEQTGQEEQVNELRLRYAMIFQNLGYYGNAIKYAESVANSPRSRYDHEQHFYAVLLVFEFLMCINSTSASAYKDKLDHIVVEIREPYRLGLYKRLLGSYYFRNDDYAESRRACEEALEIYEGLGFEDDVVRVKFTMVMILLKEGILQEAQLTLADIEKRIVGMQSGDIKAEYWLMRLKYCVRNRADEDVLLHTLGVCEDIRAGVRDANVAMRLDAGLFRARLAVADYEKAARHFRRYYEGVKKVVANLPASQYVEEYMRNEELISIVDDFKKIRTKNPNRSPCDRFGSP